MTKERFDLIADCPLCGKTFQAEESHETRKIKQSTYLECPHCKGGLVVDNSTQGVAIHLGGLKVYTNGFDWVVAESADDAFAVWLEHSGERESNYDWMLFEFLPDDRLLAIWEDDQALQIVKTCGEWAEEHGRGVIASTEF